MLLAVLVVVAACGSTIEMNATLSDTDCFTVTCGGFSGTSPTPAGNVTYAANGLKACVKTGSDGKPLPGCSQIASFSATYYNDVNGDDRVQPTEIKSTVAGSGSSNCLEIGQINGTFNQSPPYNPRYEIKFVGTGGEKWRTTGSLNG